MESCSSWLDTSRHGLLLTAAVIRAQHTAAAELFTSAATQRAGAHTLRHITAPRRTTAYRITGAPKATLTPTQEKPETHNPPAEAYSGAAAIAPSTTAGGFRSDASPSTPIGQGPSIRDTRTEPGTVSGETGQARVTQTPGDSIVEYQKQDAAKGFPEAQYALGMRYMTGNGVPKDTTKGTQLINQAADNGSDRAREKRREIWAKEREAAAAALTAAAERPKTPAAVGSR